MSNCPFILSRFLGNQSSGLPYMCSSTQGKVLLCLIYNVYREDSFSRAWLSQELPMPSPPSPLGNVFVYILLGTSEVPKLGSGFHINSSFWTPSALQRFRLFSLSLIPHLLFQSPWRPVHGKDEEPSTTASGSAWRRLTHLNPRFMHSSLQRQLCFLHFFTHPWKVSCFFS